MTLPTEQTIHLHNRAHRVKHSQPITTGLPWPKGAIQESDQLVAFDRTGKAIPAGFRTTNRWDDGSVQWSLVDFAVDLAPSEDVAIRIASAADKTPKHKHGASIKLTGDTAVLSNGLTRLHVSGKAGEFITKWQTAGKALIKDNAADFTFKGGDGKTYSVKAAAAKLRIEHENQARVCLRIDGKHASSDGTRGSRLLDFFVRIEMFAGRADVRITHSFRNREKPTPGIKISDFNATFPTTMPKDAKRCYTANTRTWQYLTWPMRIDEDPQIVASDTGDLDNWATAHKKGARADCFVRNPEVLHDPVDDKPWWLRDPKFRFQAGGSKCVWPYLGLMSDAGGVLICLKEMTSLHPKELTVNGSDLLIKLYPEWAGELDITQGAGRSHTIFVGPLDAKADDQDIQNLYLSWEFGGVHTHVPSELPVEIQPDLDHLRACNVFAIDMLPKYEPDQHFFFERKVLDAWIGVSYGQLGAVDQVSPWPAAGIWDYGDHGNGNNEEMQALPYFQNYLRTGNFGCYEKALAGTTHMMEVDHCAFSTVPFQTGGQVAHTGNHNDGTAYPSHMWFTEYLFAYVMTGDEEFKRTAMAVCECLLNWINTEEGFRIISSDQREAGQPMINLTWCYHFTRDQRYLDGCWKIVRDYLMANTKQFGRMLDGKPDSVHPVKVCSYGDYAAWEGMFWLWQITGDKELKDFMLQELEWRLKPQYMGVHGFHRTTDYNPAAYAYYMTGDASWMTRVGRPFKGAFKAARWPLGWVHAMYYIKAAFKLGIVCDDDITVC